MATEHAAPPRDGPLAALAARQHGVLSLEQLLAAGIGRGGVKARVAAGRLHRVHQGVYAVGQPRLARSGSFMAAVLACGDRAVLSHWSAAEAWGLRPGGGSIHVTAPTHRNRPGLIVHESPLRSADAAQLDGIPVTSPARTLIDLADVATRRILERAIDQAEYLRLDCSGLTPLPGRRGSGLLRSVLDEHAPGSTLTRSELEERFLALCGENAIPRPEVNAHVETYEVDCLWRHARLIVELDGRQAHTTARAFERDRLRDADLTAAGWRVVRLTYRRIEQAPGDVAAQLGRAIRLGRP